MNARITATPYMTLAKAKGMYRLALQFWHVGAARTKADRETQADARRRLLQKLFPSPSVVFSPDGQLLATSGHDNTVRLWNAATGQTFFSPDHHPGHHFEIVLMARSTSPPVAPGR